MERLNFRINDVGGNLVARVFLGHVKIQEFKDEFGVYVYIPELMIVTVGHYPNLYGALDAANDFHNREILPKIWNIPGYQVTGEVQYDSNKERMAKADFS